MALIELSRFTVEDKWKRKTIDGILSSLMADECMEKYEAAPVCELHALEAPETKFCPECGRKYPEFENFCFECLVKLKEIRDVNVRDLEIRPAFNVENANKWNDFEDILTHENLERIADFNFKISDYKRIIKNIKSSALRTLDSAIKDNEIHLDSLKIEDRILLFSKSFVEVDFKSYGGELGYFEFNKIHVDDRQLPALMMTTLLHELSHFLLKEIITEILCELLDCTKTSEIESIAIFILSYTPVNQLIDEYAAHTVEGRFTLFGYQDYSSYLNIQKTIDLPAEEIEMIKTIGNSFSNSIKDILEAFIDSEMLEDIKDSFRRQILDRPDYRNLAHENCTLLNSTGMIQAIRFVILDGFAISMENIGMLKEYNQHWSK